MIMPALVVAYFVIGNMLFAATAVNFVRHRGRNRIALLLTLTAGTLTCWAYFRMMTHSSPYFESQVFWLRCAQIASTTASVFWFLTSVEYTQRIRPGLRKWMPVLFLPPLVFGVLVWTTQTHGLVWTQIYPSPDLPNVVLFKRGVIGNVTALYSTALTGLTTWIMFQHIWVGRWRDWRRNWSAVVSVAVPALTYLVYITNLTRGVDLTVIGLSVTVWVLGFGGTSFRLIDIMPTREQLIEKLQDGLLVLGDDDTVLDMNSAARRMLGLSRGARPVWEDMLTERLGIAENERAALLGMRAFQCVVSPVSQPKRYIELSGRMLGENDAGNERAPGRMVVLRDVTAQMSAEHALIALNHTFESQLLARTAELHSTAAQLVNAQEAERARIARELHDQVGAHFAVMGMSLSMARASLSAADAPAAAQLTRTEGLLAESSVIIRQLMADLHPPELDESGLLVALRWFGEQWAERSGHIIDVRGDSVGSDGDGVECLGRDARIAIFRIAQEALNNVARHADARAVWITLKHDAAAARVTMTIRDDGGGFDAAGFDAGAPPRQRSPRSGWGMATMRERAHAIGARCEIDSAPGRGTTIRVIAPCNETAQSIAQEQTTWASA